MSHFFETDLPLPLARTLQLDKMAPPERVRAVREELCGLLPNLGTCRLSEEERALLEVPVMDRWYHFGRSSKLHQLEYMLDFSESSSEITHVTKEMLKAAADGCYGCSSADLMLRTIRRHPGDGLLVADLLLSRAVRRVEESVRARLRGLSGKRRSELKQRWARIDALHKGPPPDPPAVLPESAPPGPVRDLCVLGQQISDKVLREGCHKVLGLMYGLKVPALSPDEWDKDEKREQRERQLQKVRKSIQPASASVMRACLMDLFPAEPWLVEHSGVVPESAQVLLDWHDEFSRFGPLAAQLEQDAHDTERVAWTHGRSLIRTVFHDFADALIAQQQAGQFDPLLFHVSHAVSRMRQDPPPKLVWQGVREKRDRMEWEWRARLGVPLPGQETQE